MSEVVVKKNYYALNREKRVIYQREYNKKNYHKIKDYNRKYFLKKYKGLVIDESKIETKKEDNKKFLVTFD